MNEEVIYQNLTLKPIHDGKGTFEFYWDQETDKKSYHYEGLYYPSCGVLDCPAEMTLQMQDYLINQIEDKLYYEEAEHQKDESPYQE